MQPTLWTAASTPSRRRLPSRLGPAHRWVGVRRTLGRGCGQPIPSVPVVRYPPAWRPLPVSGWLGVPITLLAGIPITLAARSGWPGG
jgi:hypothetical protein